MTPMAFLRVQSELLRHGEIETRGSGNRCGIASPTLQNTAKNKNKNINLVIANIK